MTSQDNTKIHSQSTLRWPIQKKPHQQTWRTWEKALNTLCRTDRTLRRPQTNKWRVYKHLHRQWTYLHDNGADTIYNMKTKQTYKKTINKRQYSIYTRTQNHPSTACFVGWFLMSSVVLFLDVSPGLRPEACPHVVYSYVDLFQF